jgi:hypothetical protein
MCISPRLRLYGVQGDLHGVQGDLHGVRERLCFHRVARQRATGESGINGLDGLLKCFGRCVIRP